MHNKYRLLYWGNSLGIGGTEATMERQAIELGKRGHEVVVSCFLDGDMHRAQNLTNQCGVRIQPITRDKKEQEFQQLMNEFEPDIVHSFRSGGIEFPEPGRDFALNGAKFVETNVFGNYDHNPLIHKTLYMSEYLWKEVARTTGPQFDFLNNATPKPAIAKPLENPIKKMCGPDTIVLGRIGRDDDGIYDSIAMDALGILFKRRPELQRRILVYVMSPPPSMKKDFEKYQINYLVHQTTIRPELISAFLFNSDIYIGFRRDGESFGCNLAEASIHSLPVITHVARPDDNETFPFQNQCRLIENGKTGFVVPHNAEDYANVLEKLIDDPDLRIKMGKAGYEKAMREFGTGVCVDKLERIYGELVND